MAKLPYERCEEDDEESLTCTDIECQSLFDTSNNDFIETSCPVETRFRPIKCINIKYDTVIPPGNCSYGHDVGHNESFIHVLEGCAATFKACTDTPTTPANGEEKDPPTSPVHPSRFPPGHSPVNPPTTRIPPLQSPFRKPDDGNDDPSALTIGLAIGSGLIVIMVVVMVMFYYRRLKKSDHKGNKKDDNKKVTNVISGDHVYTDITPGEDVSTGTVRKELPGDYVTINEDVDLYDHCRHPTEDTEKQTGKSDTYDSLGSGKINVSVISDDKYDTTRDITYDRLHDKENSSTPGSYDVLPVQMN